ncbi:PIN-like domain-containing protein [Aeromonas salmonicida]|uniref:PIN-like domain-containing protein n=1 Tax=Aeromonas salmonicida TaxID=645 RepID=UPI00285CE742|nr:PIN-like domain-containing protein [Aeromonas salmonicida]MDR7021156.1 hypothetical protein [Aeromonas salmonicida]
MKSTFKSFYSQDPEELKSTWESDNTIFVFDANVLLNLYGYAKQTRDDFFKILEKLKLKIWIPYHVGLEYQRRRLDVMRNEKIIFNDIDINLQKIQNTFKSDFEKLALKRRFPKLFESTEKLEIEIDKLITEYKETVSIFNSQQPCVRSNDEIRGLIDSHFDNSIGDKPISQAWLDDIYKEGNERYKNKIPPGFKDAGKAKSGDDSHFIFDGLSYERQFGDLILWKQLLTKAKEDNIENVVFITDDSKEDWWNHINSNGKKITGPIPELQAEIYRESNIKQFHMYNTASFMEDGNTYLSVAVNESSIEDAGIQHIHFANNEDYNSVRVEHDSNINNEHYTSNFYETNNIHKIEDILERTQNPYGNESVRKHLEMIERAQNPYENESMRKHLEMIKIAQNPYENESMRKHLEMIKIAQNPYENESMRKHLEMIERAQNPYGNESMQKYIEMIERENYPYENDSVREHFDKIYKAKEIIKKLKEK